MDFNDSNLNSNPELNITPLVDIMLVLLAIFMLAVPAISYKEDIKLPVGSKHLKASAKKKVEILLTKSHKIVIDGKVYAYKGFADRFMLYSNRLSKTTPIYIKADKRLIYDNVIYVLRCIKEAGFYKVALITSA